MVRMVASADGWRGRLPDGFSPADAELLVRCILDRFAGDGLATILLSHDSREGGPETVARAARAIAQLCPGTDILLLPHLPTPIASAIVAGGGADLAILVTASHNPADWNGIKVKCRPGVPLTGPNEAAIDALYRDRAARQSAAGPPDDDGHMPKPADIGAAVSGHIVTLLSLVGAPESGRLRIVVDGLNGIAGAPMRRLCETLGHEVIALGEEPRADFGGGRPDPTLAASRLRCREAVLAHGADLGLVLDGDGDRLILLDSTGKAVQSQELMSLLLCRSSPAIARLLSGDIFVTTSCGAMIRRTAAAMGATLVEAPVGFKHVASRLRAAPNSVGTGSVGDLAFQALTTDRDPMATMVLLLAMLAYNRAPLHRLLADLRRELALDHLRWFERHLILPDMPEGAPLLAARVAKWLDWSAPMEAPCDDGARLLGPDSQWLLVRESTTEGGYRLYGEFIAADSARLADDDLAIVGQTR